MVCTAHRLQCKVPHFPKHKYPMHTTRNIQTQLKSTLPTFMAYGLCRCCHHYNIIAFSYIMLWVSFFPPFFQLHASPLSFLHLPPPSLPPSTTPLPLYPPPSFLFPSRFFSFPFPLFLHSFPGILTTLTHLSLPPSPSLSLPLFSSLHIIYYSPCYSPP